MKEPAAKSTNVKSEMRLLLGIVIGLAAIAGFFYWWGNNDQGFAERKAALLLNQLTRVTDERPSQTGMSLFVSYCKEADTTARLLDSALDPETYLQVARQRVNAMCTLVSMGAVDRAPELADLCTKLKNSGDSRAREIGHCAQCSLDFERQYVLCKHKMIVEEIVKLASDESNGEAGQKLAARIRDHQKKDWKVGVVVPEFKELAEDLPQGNQLTPNLDRYLSQLLDIEDSLENVESLPEFTDWIDQAQGLVAQYPDNVDICRSIVRSYDRLADLQCYDEARQLLDAAMEGYEKSASGGVDGEVEALVDRRAASEIQLDRWKDLVHNNPDSAAKLIEPMVEGAQQLQSQQLVSKGIVDRYIEVVDALEQTQQYDTLSKVRESLLPVFASNAIVADRFQNYCAASSKRAALVGKPFALPSQLAAGAEMDADIFKDRVTAVVFWAADDPVSFEMLQKLDRLYTEHKDVGFSLLAINIDQDLTLVRTMLQQQVPEWGVVVATGPDATGNNPLAVEYGIHTAPYLILVDTQGMVVDVALTVRDMWDRASELLPDLKTEAAPRRRGPARGGR